MSDRIRTGPALADGQENIKDVIGTEIAVGGVLGGTEPTAQQILSTNNGTQNKYAQSVDNLATADAGISILKIASDGNDMVNPVTGDTIRNGFMLDIEQTQAKLNTDAVTSTDESMRFQKAKSFSGGNTPTGYTEQILSYNSFTDGATADRQAYSLNTSFYTTPKGFQLNSYATINNRQYNTADPVIEFTGFDRNFYDIDLRLTEAQDIASNGYGELHLRRLANPIGPKDAANKGYVDSNSNKFYVQTTQPTSMKEGDGWFNPSTGELKIYTE